MISACAVHGKLQRAHTAHSRPVLSPQELHRRRVEERKREQEKRVREAMDALRWVGEGAPGWRLAGDALWGDSLQLRLSTH